MECKECGILRESKKTTWYTTKQLCSRCYNRLYSRKYRIEKKEIVKSHNKTYYENNKQTHTQATRTVQFTQELRSYQEKQTILF